MYYTEYNEEEIPDKDDECYYGFDSCVDLVLRDHCGCIGCFVICPPKEA